MIINYFREAPDTEGQWALGPGETKRLCAFLGIPGAAFAVTACVTIEFTPLDKEAVCEEIKKEREEHERELTFPNGVQTDLF